MEIDVLSHLIAEKAKLIARVRRIRGQVEAIERALDNEAACGDVLQLVAAVRGAIGGLSHELIEHHIQAHVLDPDHAQAPERRRAAEDLMGVLRTYLK